VETRTYRSDGTLASIAAPAVGDLAYTYDGKKQKLSESGGASNGPQTFQYDNDGRLTGWSNGTANQSWVLSPVGDWQRTTRDGVVETRAHDAAHELTAIGTSALSYDPQGNVVADDKGNALAWDFTNQLLSFNKAGAGAVSYLYDVEGHKVGRTDASSTIVYVHADNEVVAEYKGGALGIDYILGADV